MKAVLMIAAALALALALPGCGSEESKMERGVAVDQEVAVPDSAREDAMTEAERRAQEEKEVEDRSKLLFQDEREAK